MHEKTIKAETLYRGRLVDVEMQDVELETGQTAVREIVRHKSAVAVLARLPDGRFVFIRQFRKPAEKIMLEVVAGLLDEGEDPVASARRELKEETGYEALSIDRLGQIYPSPGYLDERIDIFFAELPETPGQRDLDHDERLEVIYLSSDQFSRMIQRGEVEDSKTLATWSLFLNRDT